MFHAITQLLFSLDQVCPVVCNVDLFLITVKPHLSIPRQNKYELDFIFISFNTPFVLQLTN